MIMAFSNTMVVQNQCKQIRCKKPVRTRDFLHQIRPISAKKEKMHRFTGAFALEEDIARWPEKIRK